MRAMIASIGTSVLMTVLAGPSYHRTDHFLKLPPGRTMGSSSAVAVDHAGHIWVAERCGANDCAGSKIDPILEFDAKGNFIKAFGHGMLLFPHGFFIDRADHIWITDAHVGDGKGDDVLEFDQSGRLLRTRQARHRRRAVRLSALVGDGLAGTVVRRRSLQ